MEASYTIIRLLQTFPNIRLPPGVPNEPVGVEEQDLGMLVAPHGSVDVLLTEHCISRTSYGAVATYFRVVKFASEMLPLRYLDRHLQMICETTRCYILRWCENQVEESWRIARCIL